METIQEVKTKGKGKLLFQFTTRIYLLVKGYEDKSLDIIDKKTNKLIENITHEDLANRARERVRQYLELNR